uniref:FCH and double SH3 domains 2 n=1 Tax=Neogobius melanostomus TaxID=47308 RepID=A0A8C6SQS9_9GOBI
QKHVVESKLSLFQSRSSLQRASVKLKAKRSECNSKATHARNDYLLTLAAANAHQQRYYDTDLTDCIKVLDGKIHTHVKDCLVSLCRTELETYEAAQNTFTRLFSSSSEVCQIHLEQFVEKNPMFQRASDFLFQPNDSDTVTRLSADSGKAQVYSLLSNYTLSFLYFGCNELYSKLQREVGTSEEHTLDKEARKWSSRVAREYKSIIHTQRVSTRALEEFGGTEESSAEPDAKMEAARQSLRRAQTVKAKAEARLDVLRQAGVAVETWLKSAMNQVMEELENERWNNLSGANDPRCRVSSVQTEQDVEFPLNRSGQVGYVPENMLQALAALDARSHSSSNSTEPELELHSAASTETRAALYDYAAQTEDELSFPEGAIIRVLSRETREDDGFWRASSTARWAFSPRCCGGSDELRRLRGSERRRAGDAHTERSSIHHPARPAPPPPPSAAPVLPSHNGHQRPPPKSPFHSEYRDFKT